eukprot:TRINITY_DN7123_c0_g1_i1.p1 TRINITY_DN7123_c0_g1~~TRINITY_DN7123_c0_g1_i1.p1  ORF type:complete len:883 (+),score=229.92 TRINITY_DN7123_c0_g1_i1:229-2649(+)
MVAVFPNKQCKVLTRHATGLMEDVDHQLYTIKGRVVACNTAHEPLTSWDGRYCVYHTLSDNQITVRLEDDTKVAREADGEIATWSDGHVVVVAPDGRTVLDSTGKVLTRDGHTVEVDSNGFLTQTVGSYQSPSHHHHHQHHPQTDFSASSPQHPSHHLSTAHGFDDQTNQRTALLKEALNNANNELRLVKEALELSQKELSSIKHNTTNLDQVTLLETKIGDLEEENRKRRWETEDVIQELQRELRDASFEDAATLQRLKLAVEDQSRRVTARDEEILLLKKQLEASEKRRSTIERTLHSTQQSSQDDYTQLATSHQLLSRDYSILRDRAVELESQHNQCLALLSQERSEKESLRVQLESKMASIAEYESLTEQKQHERDSYIGREMESLKHQIQLEKERRSRAETTLQDIQSQHASHTEETVTQVSKLTRERDHFKSLYDEEVGKHTQISWESEVLSKENERLKKQEARHTELTTKHQEQKASLEAEVSQLRESISEERTRLASIQNDLNEEKASTLKTISDTEAARASAEERNKTLTRQIKEQTTEITRLRSDAKKTEKSHENSRKDYKAKERKIEAELQQMKITDQKYRTDREEMEETIASMSSKVSMLTEENQNYENEIERLEKKIYKAERRRVALEAKAVRQEESLVSAAQLTAVSRERDEAVTTAESVSIRAKKLLSELQDREVLIETLRSQLALSQEEKQVLLTEREIQASQRVSISTKYHSVPPTPPFSPAPFTPAAASVGRKCTRWTSPARSSTGRRSVPHPSEEVLASVVGLEYAKMIKHDIARNHPPLSPSPRLF